MSAKCNVPVWASADIPSAHQDGHRLAPADRDRRAVDAYRDRIAPEQAFMQDLDLGPFGKAELNQAALQFGCRQAGALRRDLDGGDPAAKPAVRDAERDPDCF